MTITPLLDTLRLEKIDDEIYFSEKYNGYISNSRLSLIDPSEGGTPEKFFEGLSKNKIYSPALSIGSAVHELCLQNDLFMLVDNLDKPTAKLGFVADFIYDKMGDSEKPDVELLKLASQTIGYYQNSFTDTRIQEVYDKCTSYWNRRKVFENGYNGLKTPIFLDENSRNTVLNCVNSINNSKQIQRLLHPEGFLETPISENEQAVLLDVLVEIPNKQPFTLRLKSKLDNFTIDTETNTITVNDIKTIGKILSEFDKEGGNITRFHYNREIAMYSWLLSLVAKKYYGLDNCSVKGNYLVVSTIPAYYSKVVPMTPKMYKKGWTEFVTLLKLVAKYVSEGYRFE